MRRAREPGTLGSSWLMLWESCESNSNASRRKLPVRANSRTSGSTKPRRPGQGPSVKSGENYGREVGKPANRERFSCTGTWGMQEALCEKVEGCEIKLLRN